MKLVKPGSSLEITEGGAILIVGTDAEEEAEYYLTPLEAAAVAAALELWSES